MRCANTKHINDFLNNQDKDTKENERYEMKKSLIIIYHNTILDKKVYIVVFINKPFDLDKAKEVLKLYSSSEYVYIHTGINAVTFIERKENINRHLLTGEEFYISKIMLMSLPDGKGNLYGMSFDETIKMFCIEKAIKYIIEDK